MLSSGEFTQEFKSSLLVVIRAGQSDAESNSSSESTHNPAQERKSRARKLIHACNRATLSWLSDFCRIDLLADDDRDRASWRRKWWPHLVFVVMLLNTAMLIEACLWQYRYDIQLFKYERLQAKLKDLPPTSAEASRRLLERLVSEASERLKTFGGRYLEWPFIREFAIMFYLPIVFLHHLIVPYIFHRFKPKFHALRMILDDQIEVASWAQLVVDELERLERASLAFTSSKLYKIKVHLAICKGSFERRYRFDASAKKEFVGFSSKSTEVMLSLASKLASNHKILVDRLKRVALEGRLNQLQRSPKCRHDLERFFFLSFWSACLNISIGFPVFTVWLEAHFKKEGKVLAYRSFMDSIDAFNTFLMIVLSVPVTCFFLATLNVIIHDQLIHLGELRSLISDIVGKNQERLGEIESILAAATRHSQTSIEQHLARFDEALERDLLVVIVQWRLAIRSYRQVKQLITTMVVIMAGAAILMPVMFRLHSPYLDLEFNLINVMLGVSALLNTSFGIMRLALLHSCWSTLFKALWSLVALLGRLESEPLLRERLMTSSSMSILTIRREVSDPTQRLERFASRVLATPITYTTSIRSMVWFILLLSSLFDRSDDLLGKTLSHYLSDPLNLLNDNV